MLLIKTNRKISLDNIIVKLFLIIIIVELLNFLSSCSNKKNEIKPPQISNNLILSQSFETIQGRLDAGTGFILKLEGQKNKFILTALHIFGPKGGLKKQIKSKDLPNSIKNARFTDDFNGNGIIISVKPIYIPNAEPACNYVDKDLAAFRITSNENLPSLKLNTAKLTIGQDVWLAASLSNEELKSQKLFHGIITLTNDKELDFKYDNPNIKTYGTSGAPILDVHGDVIGLNLGHKIDKSNKKELIGVANPAISIKALLDYALKKDTGL